MAKQPKLVPCKYCGQEIAAGTKFCPHCGGKNKKPIYKRVWFWLLIAFILICIIAGSGGDNEPEDKKIGEVEQVQSESKTTTPAKEKETTTTADTEKETTTAAETTTEPDDNVSREYKNALKKAERYAAVMHMSKQSIYHQLTSEYGEQFPEDAAQYAMDHIEYDWNANALEKAKDYSEKMHMSKKGIYDQLISEYGEQFTAEEAQYAVDHIEADWNENALEKAKSYQEMSMSNSAIYDQLVSEYGEQFTAEEAQYAVDHLE